MALGGLIRKIFGGGGGDAAGGGAPGAAVEYNGFTITPDPIRGGNGWNTAGRITKTIDGVEKEHRFIRADHFGSRDDAIAHSLTKAQQIIDEQGERIFR